MERLSLKRRSIREVLGLGLRKYIISLAKGLLKEKEEEAGLLSTKDTPCVRQVPRPHRQALCQDMRRAQNHSIHTIVEEWKKGLMVLSHGPARWLSTRPEHVGTKHFFTNAAASKGFCPDFDKVQKSTR